jgi:3-hydroxyisobutyrate dehydrogenase
MVAESNAMAESHAPRIGFVGLGAMGGPMALNLAATHAVQVFDLRAESVEAFAEQARSVGGADFTVAIDIAALAAGCDIVFLSLPGPAEFTDVVLDPGGLIDTLAPGSLVVDLTTNSPETLRAAEPLLRAKDIALVDAPVSGGVTGARAGTLAIMVGGADDDVARAWPWLSVLGGDVLHVGAVGSGCVCKLVHNLVGVVLRQALAEGFTLGVKAGVDPIKLWECVRSGAVGTGAMVRESLPNRAFKRNFSPASFRAALSLKDIVLTKELSTSLGVPTPAADVAQAATAAVVARGWGDLDSWTVFLLQEEAAGVEVRADPPE